MLFDGNVVGRECGVAGMWFGGNVVWRECGWAGMWFGGDVLWRECVLARMSLDFCFCVARMCFAWKVIGEEWCWGECVLSILCLVFLMGVWLMIGLVVFDVFVWYDIHVKK